MKVSIVVMLARPRKKFEDVDYSVGFHHFVESLRRHNSVPIPPVTVLSPDLRRRPPGSDALVAVKTKNYAGVDNIQATFGRSVYFKLDVFRQDFDRIIYFDTDTLVLGDLSDLWDPTKFRDKGLYGMRETSQLGLTNPAWQGRMNAGVLVINRSFLQDGATYERMLGIAKAGNSYDLGDQGVISTLINQDDYKSNVGELHPRYNTPSCARTHGDWNALKNDIRVLHFLGPRKPWRNRPEHEWFHLDTQSIWDNEIKHHSPPTKRDRKLRSSLHTHIVRLVQRYKASRGEL